MKKVLLGLFLVSIISFCLCCGFDTEKERTLSPTKIKVLSTRTTTINNIETRMVAWEKEKLPAEGFWEGHERSIFWLLHPAEKITDDLEDKTIKMTYRITRLQSPPIVYVLNIEVVNQQ